MFSENPEVIKRIALALDKGEKVKAVEIIARAKDKPGTKTPKESDKEKTS